MQTLECRPSTSTLNPQPSTLNPQPSTLNPQPLTLNPQPSTLNPKAKTLSSKCSSFGKCWAVSKLVAGVSSGLATDTTVHLSGQGGALKINRLTLTIRASDSSWHPGLPGRPLFPGPQTLGEGAFQTRCSFSRPWICTGYCRVAAQLEYKPLGSKKTIWF